MNKEHYQKNARPISMFAELFFSLLTHTSKMIVQIILLQSLSVQGGIAGPGAFEILALP